MSLCTILEYILRLIIVFFSFQNDKIPSIYTKEQPLLHNHAFYNNN